MARLSKKLTKTIYLLLSEDKPVTPVGARYLLRNESAHPAPAISEVMASFHWLVANKFAVFSGDGGCGSEYLKAPRRPSDG